MKANTSTTLLALGLVALLSACGEKPQTLGSTSNDAAAFTGTGKAYAVPGWKQGDKASWEQQLRSRAQNSQNEYNRTVKAN